MALIRMNGKHRYSTSRDYEKLWDLAQETSVICVVDYHECRDIASTLFYARNYEVSARGISYVHARDKEDFIKQCSQVNLEYIDPGAYHHVAEQMKELLDLLRQEQPAFAADLDNGHDLISTFDGHFVAWDEIIDHCQKGLGKFAGYLDSPAELITRLIDQRDEFASAVENVKQELVTATVRIEELEKNTCGDCSPENYGWIFNRVEGKAACGCMTEAEPFQILLKALEMISMEKIEYGHLGAGSPTKTAIFAKEALKSVLPLDYSE